MSTKTVVVVGHGMVGHRFVQNLRTRDVTDQWRVVVLCEEPDAAYDRVGLSSYVSGWDRSALALAGNDYLGDDLVAVRLGESAASIDRSDCELVTTNWVTVGARARTMPAASLSASTPSTATTPPNWK